MKNDTLELDNDQHLPGLEEGSFEIGLDFGEPVIEPVKTDEWVTILG